MNSLFAVQTVINTALVFADRQQSKALPLATTGKLIGGE
jgi:hypothetical protein